MSYITCKSIVPHFVGSWCCSGGEVFAGGGGGIVCGPWSFCYSGNIAIIIVINISTISMTRMCVMCDLLIVLHRMVLLTSCGDLNTFLILWLCTLSRNWPSLGTCMEEWTSPHLPHPPPPPPPPLPLLTNSLTIDTVGQLQAMVKWQLVVMVLKCLQRTVEEREGRRRGQIRRKDNKVVLAETLTC